MQSAARLLASVLLIAVAAPLNTSATAAELQWRGKRTPATESSQPTSSVRFKSPRVGLRRDDPAVRPVAFDEQEGPQFTADASDSIRMRSVIVGRGAAADGFRSAQLPETPGEFDAQFEEELRTPFDETDLPPLEPMLPDDRLQLDDTQRPPFEPPPRDFQPVVPPDFGLPLPEVVPEPPPATMEAERQRAEENCEQGFADLRAKTIDTLDVSIAVDGEEGSDFPFECALDEGEWHAGRYWPQTVYLWKAAALCHKPLYFEDEHLERYGHSWPPFVQPFVSGAHFFATLPVLPYCMGVEPPTECIYALGHYRPGSCAPYMCNPIPFSARGALIQTGAVTGAILVIP